MPSACSGRASSSMRGCFSRRGHNGLTIPASGRAARAEWLLRLGDRARRNGADAAGDRCADQRRPGADRFRSSGQREDRGRRANTGCSRARSCRSCTARPRSKPTCRARSSRKSHEYLRPVHSSADRHGAADGRPVAVRACHLPVAAGRGAAERQLPDHLRSRRSCPAPIRRPWRRRWQRRSSSNSRKFPASPR